MGSQDSHADQVLLDALGDEFRRHLQLFYSRLKLAPPYDSVEKAVRQLTTSIKTLSSDDQRRLVSDEAFRWAHYRRAFIDSGLSQKHRGIIAGLARQRDALDLPPEFDHFLNVYA
ncbi:MAG TPA: hypothetical protein VFG71_11235 [Nitrospiraceae bacterium]|nr:hypothetical protein [Nitrospiraceae bacterium]